MSSFQVIFYNTNDKEETQNDNKAFATVIKAGGYRQSSLTSLENSRLYKGSENPVGISRVYSKDFICEFDMAHYPFDTQECSAVFVMKGNLGRLDRQCVQRVLCACNYFPAYFRQLH